MPTLKLTDLAVKNLKPGMWWDAALPGFGIRVGTTRKTWLFRFRQGGKQPRHTLGHYPVMSLAEARKAFANADNRIDAGATPKPAEPHPRSEDALTLGGLIDAYEKLRKREGHRVKTLPAAMRTLRNGLEPYLGLRARDFSKADLRAARDAIADRDALIQANRMLTYLGPVLKWGAQEDLILHNFVGDIRKAPERKRDRILTHKEIIAVWKACDRPGDTEQAKVYARMVKFLLVTGQRRDEVASLKHGDILDGKWKQIDNKASRPHSLKLPLLALALVGQGKANELVFPGKVGKLSGFGKRKAALDKAAKISGWRLHDLRRTAATQMRELGIPFHTVEAILNHQLPGIAGVYQVAELEEQKAAALKTWAAAIERIVKLEQKARA